MTSPDPLPGDPSPAAGAGSPGEPGGTSPAGPDEGAAPAPRSRLGCLAAVGVASGGLLLLALLAIGVALTEPGKIVTELEETYIREAVDRARLDGDEVRRIENVLERHREEARRQDMGPSAWWAAGKAFEGSPATIVLSLLNARANLDWIREESLAPLGKKEVKAVLARMAQGVARGKITAPEYLDLLERAKVAALAGEEPTRAMDTALDPAQVRRFAEMAEKLAEMKEVPAARDFPDLAPLLETDLAWSLEEGKRSG